MLTHNTTLFKNLCVCLLGLSVGSFSARAVPSFPGAEGWGAITTGGRGGAVLHVTNLNDSGAGSLRAALTASGPRTVVFDVSGTINLTSEIRVTNSLLTIAGQTAPGNGILIAGATIDLNDAVSDVIVRFLRIRRSYDKAAWATWVSNGSPAGGPLDPRGQCMVGLSTTSNIMVDHVSVSWGTDENMSIYRRFISPPLLVGGPTVLPARNITIQWCISSEALNAANHAYADTLGGKGVNHHHNLLACNVGRNPSISFSYFMDWRNNVIFNWRDRTMDGAGAEAHMNVISNYYKPGPASGLDFQWNPIPLLKVRITKPEIRANGALFGFTGNLTKNRYCYPGAVGYWYVEGNIVEGYPEVSSNNWEGQSLVSGNYYRGVQWGGATSDGPIFGYPGYGPAAGFTNLAWAGHYMTNHLDWAQVTNPITHVDVVEDPNDPSDDVSGLVIPIPDLPVIATEMTMEAYQSVLAGAGATLPVRDPVDVRTTNMVVTGIATAGTNGMGIINHPDEVGGYPVMPVVTRPAGWDTDGDGMPDDWETAHGLDPNNAADRNGDYDNDGYTNLEEYLNELGAFKAVHDVVWDGSANNRYARIENWNIAFQPSRFDTAVISNAAVVVDAIGQDAGILRLLGNATLNITAGRLKVANRLEIGAGCIAAAKYSGNLTASNVVNSGTLRLTGSAALNVGGSFTNYGLVDIMTWGGTLPAGFVNLGNVLDRSAIRVISMNATGADFEATIYGYIGHNYQLQYRDDLSSGDWTSLSSPVAGNDAPITLTHTGGAAAQQRFYRVAVD